MALHSQLMADAANVLDRADIPHGQIVSVDRDSILFLGDGPQPLAGAFTAWLQLSRVALVQDGFEAQEPVGLHPPPQPLNYGLAGAVK